MAKKTKLKPKPVKPVKGGGFLGNRPAKPRPLNPKAITTTAIQQGNRLSDAQEREYKQLYGTLAKQQRGQIDALAKGLDNSYTRDARAAVTGSLGDAKQMGALGTTLADQAQQGFATAGPTEIEQELYRQGQAELGLGRSLSPEQLREATQSARGAFAARGLGTSMGSAAAELLNRDRYATEREAQRRQFAAGANQMRENNVLARRDSAGRMGALSGDLFNNAARTRQLGATLMGEIDPYARAMTPGLSLGQSAQQYGLNTTGNNFGNTLQLGANAASFNTNMAGDLYADWMSNNAALKGANTTAQATRDASRRTTGDYIIGGLQALNPFG